MSHAAGRALSGQLTGRIIHGEQKVKEDARGF
jgi:hypothetical protein